MSALSQAERWLVYALVYCERYKFSILPIGENKKPPIPWARFQNQRATVTEILSWRRQNLAIITGAVSQLVVVDCESREDAKWFWNEHIHPQKNVGIVKTKRGYHFYLGHPGVQIHNAVHLNGRYDVRGDGGYVVAPPSSCQPGEYTWVKPIESVAKLLRFDPSWGKDPLKQATSRTEIHHAEQYISTIFAVEGSAGHDQTYKVACILRDANLGEIEAFLALQRWNKTNADPPWSEQELLHKIQSAFQQKGHRDE